MERWLVVFTLKGGSVEEYHQIDADTASEALDKADDFLSAIKDRELYNSRTHGTHYLGRYTEDSFAVVLCKF